MISKLNRFHGHNSLNAVYQRGEAVSLSQVSLKSLPARNGKGFRIAVVVSRKVSKSAVVRNRIRRRVYEIMRRHMPLVSSSNDIVINVYNEQLATMTAKDIEDILTGLLLKARLLTDEKLVDHAIVNTKEERI
jgi:ribonuclease P protein component